MYVLQCTIHTCDIEVALVEFSIPASTQLRLIAPVHFGYVISLYITCHIYRGREEGRGKEVEKDMR